ncbi:hypothetical protein PHISCL_10929 [Aspergillus sclerotialis]|uniref:Uncharacterized protein n=1 Tax=Aspergillus sclerotialis TaxID=2070753 RepID=A0A3A2ZBF6_9EURO|nr:hypothetical protein PHISCL_10929 [Aspergillus sclerotialis]
MHAYDTRYPDLLVVPRIKYIGTFTESALVDPRECQLSEAAFLELERQTNERKGLVRDKLHRGLVAFPVQSRILSFRRVW